MRDGVRRRCKAVPNVPALVRNVLAVYGRASEAARAEGLSWYAKAHAWAAKLAEEYHLSVDTVAAVVAVLSPATDWARNVRDAAALVKCGGRYETVTVCTYGPNKAKAVRLLGGETPDRVVGGAKVRAFWQLIRDPCDAAAVCIDRHAMAVAYGRTLTDAERASLRAPRRFRAVQDAYRRAAAAVGLTPSQLQAATWTQWRYENAARPAAVTPF